MKHQVIIRKAAEKDLPAIVELWKELMDFHQVRDPYFTRSEDGHEAFSTFMADNLKKQDSLVLIAQKQDDIIGYTLAMIASPPPVFKIKRYGEILDFAVTEKYRRLGIGEIFVQRLKKWFDEKNIQRIEVRVATSNEVSQPFWRKMGFSPYLEILSLEL
jgi:ribosomal protein S18 acetylase RimI-like enzyme